MFLWLVPVTMRIPARKTHQFAVIVAGLLLALPGCASGRRGAEAAAGPSGKVITVEAVGFATMHKGKTMEAAHQGALLDARRNALIQAQALIQSDARVRDMRLAETFVHSRTLGYVERVDVLDAGQTPDADPPVYRVRVRAAIRALPGLVAGPTGRDQWQPIILLKVGSNLPPEARSAFASSVSEGLRRCGARIAHPDEKCAALLVELLIAAASAADQQWMKVEWAVSVGPPGPTPMQPTPGGIRGHWVISKRPGPDSEWWQRVAARIAQDATRLWATPRTTLVRFTGTSRADAQEIKRVIGEVPAGRVDTAEDLSEVVVVMPVAGNPVAALESLLSRADLSQEPRLVQVSLTELTYSLSPPSEADSAEGAGQG